MTTRLVVEATGFGVRGALLEEGLLTEVADADSAGDAVTDAFFLGQVRSVDRRLNAAFLDIGTGAEALLNAKDARHAAGAEERRPISQLVREGESLVVQGVREGEGGKGARVTTDLKLFGFHLIWRPRGLSAGYGESARGAARAAIQQRGERLFAGLGVTLRKLAAEVEDAVLAAELEQLQGRWGRLETEAQALGRPGRLGADEHPVERLLRSALAPGLAAIEVADEELAVRLARLMEGPLRPHRLELVRLDSRQPAFEQTEVQAALDEALARVVPLRGGGRLIVEPTAACVAIDVDGEGRAALDVNIEAAFAVARLVRLRNLGGTIVVDFIDLPTKGQRQRLEEMLRKAFRGDPVPVDLYPMSPLGIVQISRARRGRSLDALLTRPCLACGGSGSVPSLRAQAEALVSQVRRARQPPLAVRVAPDLSAFLSNAGADAWRNAGAGVRLETDAQLAPGAFAFG